MKRFLKKRWHSIPVALVSALLVLTLVAGGALAALAAYDFFKADLQVKVEEALVVAIWPAWDNLEPYGSVDDVNIVLGEVANGDYTLTITTIEGYAGAGFVAGEFIVIPVNFRNAGDGALNLGATVTDTSGGLLLDCCWLENDGEVTEEREGEADLKRDFKDDGTWVLLNDWTGAIDGKGGASGSAVIGAQVLFVRVSAPGAMPPGTYTFEITLERS